MNLQEIFTKKDVADAINYIKKSSKKFYKRDFDGKWRFSSIEEREKTSMKKFIDVFNLDDYYSKLKNYNLYPYTGLSIPKKGGFRPLLIPTVSDRVIFVALLKKIKIFLEPELRKYNALGVLPTLKLYGKKNNLFKKTINDISYNIKNEWNYILCLDFKNFFSSIPRKELLDLLHLELKNDELTFNLIKKTINNNIRMDENFKKNFSELNLDSVGIPQGLAYSPLLASYYALKFDKIVKKYSSQLNIKSYRYLDDMIIISNRKKSLELIYQKIREESKKSGLELHKLEPGGKTQLVDALKEKFYFLGLEFFSDTVKIPKKSVKKFKEVFNDIFNPNNINEFKHGDILNAFEYFSDGWKRYYKDYANDDYGRVGIELEKFINNEINRKIRSNRTKTERGKKKKANFLKTNKNRILNSIN